MVIIFREPSIKKWVSLPSIGQRAIGTAYRIDLDLPRLMFCQRELPEDPG